jgi:pimeloyl-ACP methyl ester carboxylesterase
MGPVAAARLSDVDLPEIDPNRPPYPVETMQVDGRAVLVRRTPGTGDPALYVHGLGGSSTNWTDLAALLTEHVDGMALDLPGFGGSDPARDGDYSLAAHARVVARVIEQWDRGPVHLAGNSLGGAISVLVAARRPDLVKTLTLVSPAMPDLRPRLGPEVFVGAFGVPGLRRLVDRWVSRGTVEQRVRGVLDICFADPSVIPEVRWNEAVADERRQLTVPWARAAFAGSVRGILASYLRFGSRSLWAEAARITAPTAVIWGERDRLVDVVLAPRTARTIPGATLLVLPNIGHVAHLEAPPAVARAILGLLRA